MKGQSNVGTIWDPCPCSYYTLDTFFRPYIFCTTEMSLSIIYEQSIYMNEPDRNIYSLENKTFAYKNHLLKNWKETERI